MQAGSSPGVPHGAGGDQSAGGVPPAPPLGDTLAGEDDPDTPRTSRPSKGRRRRFHPETAIELPPPGGPTSRPAAGGPFRVPFGLVVALLVVLGVGFLYTVYTWFRIEVPSEHVAVLIRRTGRELANDQVVAPDERTKGVQRKVLTEGRYFYNPYDWDWKIVPQVVVPQGKVGVLVRLHGPNLAAGQIVADDDDHKGVVRQELKPGRYPEFSNPYAYAVEVRDAVTVPPGFRGVVTVVSGRTAKDPNQLLVQPGERGVQADSVEAGTHYLNPYVRRVALVDCRQKTLRLAEDQDMGFPSKDGFWIRLDGFVRFRILEKKAAELYVVYNDDQNGDEVFEEIKDNIILPNARAFCRLAGSRYSGREIIDGESRSQFQKEFEEKLRKVCEPLGLEIEAASITEVQPPQPIAEQLTRRAVAVQTKQQFLREIEEQKAQAKLAAQVMMKDRQGKLVLAEQQVVQMKTKAEEEQAVAVSKAKELLSVAQQRLKASQDTADAKTSVGLAEARVTRAKNEAEAAGLRTSVQAFGGNGYLFAQNVLYEKLAPKFHQIMANSQDSPLMRVFEQFAKVPSGRTAPERPGSNGTPNPSPAAAAASANGQGGDTGKGSATAAKAATKEGAKS